MTRPGQRGTARAAGRIGAAVAVALAATACAPDGAHGPNLLLVTVDTLRADRLACYGGEPDVGTAICAIAERGTRFRWAFSAAPYTAPSIASVLTSQYPFEHGVGQSAVSYLGEDAVTLAEVLQAHGYTTAAFVSNPVLERGRHLQQGFAIYDQRMTRRERNRPGFAERAAADTTDAALAWAEVGAHEPWFLWVHFQDPHGPYDPPGSTPMADAAGEASLPVLDDDSGLGGIPSYQAIPGLTAFETYARRYTSEIVYLDQQVKRLIEGLDALGAHPAVVLTSDHGEAFGEDGYYFAHGHSVGLDQIRVPLLWRPAGDTQASVETAPASEDAPVLDTPILDTPIIDIPVSAIDIAPTLLRAAGIDAPAAFAGRALPVAGLVVEPLAAERPIFAEHTRRAAIIAGQRYYARDRRALTGDERDRISGGRVIALPARSAELGREGAPPRYSLLAENHPALPALETRLADFMAEQAASGSTREAVPTESRERLRALGYLE